MTFPTCLHPSHSALVAVGGPEDAKPCAPGPLAPPAGPGLHGPPPGPVARRVCRLHLHNRPLLQGPVPHEGRPPMGHRLHDPLEVLLRVVVGAFCHGRLWLLLPWIYGGGQTRLV